MKVNVAMWDAWDQRGVVFFCMASDEAKSVAGGQMWLPRD